MHGRMNGLMDEKIERLIDRCGFRPDKTRSTSLLNSFKNDLPK